MKKTLTILFLTLITCSSFAKTKVSLEQSLQKISKAELTKTFKSGGLDSVIQDLYAASMKLGKKYIKAKKNKMGQKIRDKKGRIALIKIVEATHHINKNMHRGTLHYYGPAKLYKNFRVDMNLAIEKARIPTDGKNAIRATLPNSY